MKYVKMDTKSRLILVCKVIPFKKSIQNIHIHILQTPGFDVKQNAIESIIHFDGQKFNAIRTQ